MDYSDFKKCSYGPVDFKQIEPLLKSSAEESQKIIRAINDSICTRDGTAAKNDNLKYFVISTIQCAIESHKGKSKSEDKLRRLITELFTSYLQRNRVDEIEIFKFVYVFLLGEIYDGKQLSLVANIDEEYKLAISQCMISLMKSLTYNALSELYTSKCAPMLSQMLAVLTNMAMSEKFLSLRMTSIECIMAISQVDDAADTKDSVLRWQVADIYVLFSPGVISNLASIALEDETQNHKVILLAVRAWGRIVALQYENYNAADDPPLENEDKVKKFNGKKFSSYDDIKNFVDSKKRNASWYKADDNHLERIASKLVKLCNHSNENVKLELLKSCSIIVEACSSTMPRLIGKIFEIAVILIADDDQSVRTESKMLILKLGNYGSQSVFNNLEENFFQNISNLPRLFHNLDENEQLNGLNLLIGYLEIFGENRLSSVLHSVTHLKRLIQSLLLVSEFEHKEVSLIEEYMIQDLELVADRKTPWRNFSYFRDDIVKSKLETACAVLAKCNVQDIVCDLLLDIFMNNDDYHKEAIFILNSVISGIAEDKVKDNLRLITNIFNTYLDPEYWNLSINVDTNCMMQKAKSNVIQICLQVEGVGIIALLMQRGFRNCLYKAMYAILERAGSGNCLIKAAGTTTIAKISKACGYSGVTELITANSDYFSYHVTRKIRKSEYNESVLNVLAVVIRYSNLNALDSFSDIISGVLLETCDKFFRENSSTAYLRLFQMFFKYLLKWLNVEVFIGPIKSKEQKKIEHEDFKLSNLDELDSDDDEDNDTSTKTPEEVYEKFVKENQELENSYEQSNLEEEYEKPKPSVAIQLAAAILRRCLNFLPSKNRKRKLLVLQILIDGLELIRDWEDTLLPIVHQIWSPLVDRFEETDEPIVINYSFELLVTLARLSKDFIRSRTMNDVLPKLHSILQNYSKCSYLKDVGSTYRYTQGYKLQLLLLQQLGRVVTDLDLSDICIIATTKYVTLYLSDKQPMPLQKAAISFFRDISKFDNEIFKTICDQIPNTSDYEKSIVLLQSN